MKKRIWIAAMACILMLPAVNGAVTPVAQAGTNSALRYGSTGADVTHVQGRLKHLGYYHGKVDGVYSWRTYWSVRDFQYKFGLRTDGLAGPKTKSMLKRATPNWHSAAADAVKQQASSGSPSAPVVKGLSQSDINLLEHLVSGEARGEPFKGQVAVAAVILHRVESPKFPNTIPGVIYQPGAFTAASNGQIDVPPDATVKKAVHDAIMGWDPSHGALYYFNPAKTSNAFIWSRPEITKIGDHIFTK